jgi:hypothetical protein
MLRRDDGNPESGADERVENRVGPDYRPLVLPDAVGFGQCTGEHRGEADRGLGRQDRAELAGQRGSPPGAVEEPGVLFEEQAADGVGREDQHPVDTRAADCGACRFGYCRYRFGYRRFGWFDAEQAADGGRDRNDRVHALRL